MNENTNPMIALSVNKVAISVSGRCSFLETYSIRNGQIIEEPMVLINIPLNNSQN
jgi:hypothetical protein